MIVLGVNGGVRPGYQDISAVLLKEGKLIAAIEEERIARVKHLAGQLPIHSVHEVLRITNCNIKDVDVVAFHGTTWQASIEHVLKSHFENYFGYCPPIKRYHHHECHAASAYYASGFEEALIITIDGSGDGISTRVSIGNKNGIQTIKEFARPQSLGLFYSMMTQLCGFTRDADEYKLMGLAAYGDRSSFDLDKILSVTPEGYELNTDYLVDIAPGQPSPSRYEMLFSDRLIKDLAATRRSVNEMPKVYKDLAAASQAQLEKIITHLVQLFMRQTGIKKVCLAGGVALNCLANQKIEELPEVDELFIQPASSDAGISLGAAYLACVDHSISPEPMTHVFYGNSYTDEEIETVLKNCSVKYEKAQNAEEQAADALAENKVIGWFQGAMEFGPRALGNRSILANPAAVNIQSIVNRKIKFREGFRPFGGSILEEDFSRYFKTRSNKAPFMTKVFDVKEAYRDELNGVTHADGTCRVQTVNQNQNERYYRLLKAFKRKTGIGGLLNTSFNLNHEPIVHTPRNAIASFFSSGLELLFLNNWIVTKE